MTARATVTAGGAIAAVVAVHLVISLIIGPLTWVAIVIVLILAILAILAGARFGRRATAGSLEEERLTSRPAKGVVDCAGESLRSGDHVRAGAGFDGPMELAFGRGVVVKIGRGKAHVRFNDIPEQVHPVSPGTLRRLA